MHFVDSMKRVDQGLGCKKNEINAIDSLQAKQMRKLIFTTLFCLDFHPMQQPGTARIAGNACLETVMKLPKKNPPGSRRV
jgi:hypothetical protein